jgi:FtsZ-binding cell division protein ZapB
MSLGMAERQARARRRVMWAIVKWTAAFALVILAGLFAYKTGTSLAEIDVRNKNEEIAMLTVEKQTLQTENAGLRARAAQAQQQAAAWEQRYKADMPSGDSKTLLDLANRKRAEGVDMARLTFLINAASNPRVCDEKPETKRLQVKTPIGKTGKEAAAVFADRKITITAEGILVRSGAADHRAFRSARRPSHRSQRRRAAAASDGGRRFRVPLLDRRRRSQGFCHRDGRALQFSIEAGRTHGDVKKSRKVRITSSSRAFGDVRWYGGRRPSDLIGQSVGFDRRKLLRHPVNGKRQIMALAPDLELAEILH